MIKIQIRFPNIHLFVLYLICTRAKLNLVPQTARTMSVNSKTLMETCLLVGPGPVNCSPRTLFTLVRYPILPPSHQVYEILVEIKRLLKYVFQTQNEVTLAIQNSGSGGLEAAVVNTVDPKEVVVVAVSGYWGRRVADIARRRDITVYEVFPKEGDVFTLEELEEEIVKFNPVMLFVTHGESSTGRCQPLEGLGSMCHRHKCLLTVDAIASLGGVPFFVDEWEIDVAVSAPQKAARGLPGLSYLTFSSNAVQRMRDIKTKPPFYYDILKLGDVWKCFDAHSIYYYSYNTNMLYAAKEGLTELEEETLTTIWKKQRTLCKQLWDGLENLGFSLAVKNPKDRLLTITVAYLPDGVTWTELNEYLLTKYQIFLGPGIDSSKSDAVRIGIMGYNARTEIVEYVLIKLKEAILHCKKEIKSV